MARLPTAGPIVIPNCVEVRLMWEVAGQNFSNVLHCQNPSGAAASDANAQAAFSGISTAFTSSGWGTFVHPSCTLFKVGLRSLHTANQVEHLSTGAAVPGSAAGAGAPLNCALVVTLRTNLTGPANRGRVYLGGLADSAMANMFNTIGPANTAAAAFISGTMTVLSGLAMPLGVAQKALNAGTRHDGTALPARSANIVPVTLAEVHNARVDSQRRRTGK